MSTKKLTKTSVWVISGMVILGWIAMSLWHTTPTDSHDKKMILEFTGIGKLEMDTSKPETAYQDLEEVLETIFENDFSKAGLMDWLVKKNIYFFRNDRLVKALNEDLCEPFPENSYAAKAKATEKCADRPVAKGLRDLREKSLIPFHHLGKVLDVGVPSREDQPRIGHVSIRESHLELLGKKVELTYEPTGKQIEVEVSGRYPCTGAVKCNDMHLNIEDAVKLFPGAIQKSQKATAYVLD